MKKKISLALSIIMIAVALCGCGLFEHDYQKDYAQRIATIKSNTQKVEVYVDEYDDYGYVTGAKKEEYQFTSPEINIYKSTLVNYVDSYASTYFQNGYTSFDGVVDEILNMLIDYELVLIEADRLFFAGLLYWSRDEVDEIQRNVYATIDQELFDISNNILTEKGKPVMEKPAEEEATETTYPVKPDDDEDIAPIRYEEYETGSATYDAVRRVWSFDKWYLDGDANGQWYIEDTSKYLSAYPGMFGTEDEKSLAREAMNSYLDTIYTRSTILIGASAAQQEIIDNEVKELKRVQSTKGPEYVYPLLGKTLLIKFLIGDTLIKSKKMDKIEQYVSKELVTVTEAEVLAKYNTKFAEQEQLFTSSLTNYNQAVENGDLILYTPSDRYVFVKHILIPFSDEQKSELETIKAEEGVDDLDREKGNRANYEKRRAALAEQIVAYEHINGEDDTSNPKTLKSVYNEIKAEMAKYKNNAKYAERAFDALIYKYNTDPGIFDKPYGYPVIANLGDDETDQWMIEFADGAREFRSQPQYTIGSILDYYVVTDHGVHIMYYAADPKPFEIKYSNSYTTAGAYQTVYQVIKEQLLKERQDAAYTEWSQTYIDDFKEEYAVIEDNLVSKYIKDLNKQLGL